MTYCNIHFRVKFFTNYHETIAILGNVEPLGCWDISKACHLKTSEASYPYWQTENPIKVSSGTKLEFKFAVFKDGNVARWENLPNGENRSYRARYYLVTLDCSEAVPQCTEDVSKRFISSASLENLEEFKRVKKGKKNFDPYSNAQDSLSSDSWGDSSREKLSSEDLNSFGAQDASPLQISNLGDSIIEKNEKKKGLLSKDPAEISKNNFGLHKASDLEKLLANGENRADTISILYHQYKKQRNIPKNKPTCLINCESDDDSTQAEIEDENINILDNDKVIYVSFKLPISVNLINPDEENLGKKWKVTINTNTHLGSIYRFCYKQLKDMVWIGWIGAFVELKYQQELMDYLYKEYRCIPIFLDEEVCSQFLYEYCNQFLHDAFFNILDMKTVFFQESYVESYNSVNKIYAEKILEHADLQTLILVQDYHLMMVPKYLCLNNPKFTMGYIFETPFPTLEIMKVFYNKKELLESLLCCDLICFNTSEYVKMFSNISTKLMNIHLACEKGGHMYLRNGGRKVYIRVAYPSVDPYYINETLNSQTYNQLKEEVQEKYKSKTLIVGVAHFTKIEGIETLIYAVKSVFESEKGQNYHFCLLKFEDVYKHDKDNVEKRGYLNQIQAEVANINETMKQKGLSCEMEVIDEVISEEKKLALMGASKLLIAFSPYLDNDLHILEYLFTKVGGSGSIVLSEFAHGHKHLNSLIKVNPFNKLEIVEGIRKGLTMSSETTSYLLELDRNAVASYTAWDRFHSLIDDIKKSQSIKSRLNLKVIDEDGFFKVLSVKDNFMPLDHKKLLHDYKKSKNRIILCGFEETLIEDNIDPKKNIFYDVGIQSSQGIFEDNMDVIKALTLIPDMAVYIISSKKVETLAKEFDSVYNATLLAENGFYYKMPRETKWYSVFQCDWSWKSIVQRIMQNYANRTEGVKVDIKESSLIWNHEDVRTDIAKIQEIELVNHLTTVLTHVKNLEIVKERKSVEVKPAGISKGIACELLMDKHKVLEGGYPDFILCFGGTSKDEEMFAKLEQLARDNPEFEKVALYTCTVKMKPTNARFVVKGIPEAYEVLRMLAENS